MSSQHPLTGKENGLRSGSVVEVEQRILEWGKLVPQEDGTEVLEQAILDFVSRDALTGRQIQVNTKMAFSTNSAQLRARANKDGLAASQTATGKRVRYNLAGASLVPLAFESGRRPVEETIAHSNSWETVAFQNIVVSPIAALWQRCSTASQLGKAEQLLSA